MLLITSWDCIHISFFAAGVGAASQGCKMERQPWLHGSCFGCTRLPIKKYIPAVWNEATPCARHRGRWQISVEFRDKHLAVSWQVTVGWGPDLQCVVCSPAALLWVSQGKETAFCRMGEVVLGGESLQVGFFGVNHGESEQLLYLQRKDAWFFPASPPSSGSHGSAHEAAAPCDTFSSLGLR